MVTLKAVSKSYFGQLQVLDRLELELKKGDFLYVLGGTGAGKSSFLRLLATEELPTQGELRLFGYDLARCSKSTLRSIRQVVGFVPQNIKLIPDLSVLDNLMLSVQLAGRRASGAQGRSRAGELLDRLGLVEKRERMASTLSGGEAQRLAVARALVRCPELVIADEPTGAQDRDFTWSLMDLFLRANTSGATVVVATHDREIIRRVRKRCAIMKNGNLHVEEGSGPCFF